MQLTNANRKVIISCIDCAKQHIECARNLHLRQNITFQLEYAEKELQCAQDILGVDALDVEREFNTYAKGGR